MKKLLVLTGALVVLGASAASAQVNLAWRNCIAQAASVANETYLCDGSRNGVPFRGVLSFIAPPNMAHFVGADCLLDVQTADPTLPDYWRLASSVPDMKYRYVAALGGPRRPTRAGTIVRDIEVDVAAVSATLRELG